MIRLRQSLGILVLSLLLHGLMLAWIDPSWLIVNFAIDPAPVHIEVIDYDGGDDAVGLPDFQDVQDVQDVIVDRVIPAPEPPVPEPPDEPEPPPIDGQIVEIPPPRDQKIPMQAEYLAEYNSAVPKETRTEAFRVNPDILSDQYSRESKMALENVPDVGATEVSTGATVGSMDDMPGTQGAPRSAIPSMFTVTNKAGLAAPTAGSTGEQVISGAPQNDRLNEALGDRVALNARQLIGAEYLNRIRRIVNHYWVENIEHLPQGTPIGKNSYRTVVEAVLTTDGLLESITVSMESGSDPIDGCLVDAFRLAGPFPNPPEQLISRDGRVYLPDFDFEVNFSHARSQYQGIDPRSGVQFPGIMKNPR